MNKLKKFSFITLLIVIFIGTVSFKDNFFEIAKQIEIYTAVFKELNMYYVDDINPSQLTTDAINQSLKNLDPYTRYYDEQTIEDATIEKRGAYGGIGASSSFYNKELFIKEVYEDSPAQKSGLKAGDQIIQIDDVLVEDLEKKTLNSLLRGMPDTKVTLKIKRHTELLDIEITRNSIEIDPIPFYKMIDDEVGYMAFITFNKKASKRVKEAYDDLKKDGMKKLIIDVRGNPGGLLNEVVKIVNYFVKKDQIVVTTKAKVKKWSTTFKTKNDPIDLEIPMVILINERSASASEILSGALQDLDRAVIMGDRSFGKGLVQRFRKLPYGTQMKLTISKYYTPSGRCIQELDYTNRDLKTGIVPTFDQNKRNTFKTSKGRTVFDGGGVMPDITLDKPKQTMTTKALFKSNAIFKYAVNYQYNHQTIPDETNFELTDQDFENFIQFLKTNDTSFKTDAEIKFEEAYKIAEKNQYNQDIQTNYNQLIVELQNKKITEITVNKKEIIQHLSDEIIQQFYYKSGVYRHKFTHDNVIQKATLLLHNQKAYQNILK